ncbi:MAG: D-2-hydroxyacid dehydrogenase [Patescibacteria group bacterium]|nr:D-2-hydroxyacid dehydrogenase [Patescibacteria group bacterium]
MKLLILTRPQPKERAQRTGRGTAAPFRVTEAHLARIRKIVPRWEIAVTADMKRALAELADADVIAGFPFYLAHLPLVTMAELKWAHSFSAGMDRVLTPEVARSALRLSNSSGIHATPIAEHVIGFMLLFTRKFVRSLENQKAHRWERDETLSEVSGKTVLVVGLGDIGMEVARLAHAFGATVLAVARTRKVRPDFVRELGTAARLPRMLARADFVVVALPYTKATHHYIGADELRLMKRTAILINIGRGALVDEKALITALQRKRIAGAALDVTEIEPLPSESPLWEMENVLITPHHSGLSEKYMDRAVERFCVNLRAFLKGEKLPNEVDKRLGY